MLAIISIVTVSYNSEKTIKHCIDSVRDQNVPVEHVLVDGASTDGTHKIIREYQNHFSKVIVEPDNGIYDAMNKGIDSTTGDIIGILNSDDYYATKNSLSKVVSVFCNDEIQACYGDLKYVDAQDEARVVRYWKAGEFDAQKFYWGWMPPHPTFLVRRSVYQKLGTFNLSLGSAADYEIMLRFLLKHRIGATYVPYTLVNMRTGGMSNASLANRLRANLMDRRSWEINQLKPYPWTLYLKPLRKLPQWFMSKV